MQLTSEEVDYIRYSRREDVSYTEIIDTLSNHDIETVVSVASHEVPIETDIHPIKDEPWKDEELVHQLYEQDNLMVTEIAVILNCDPSEVKKTVDKYIPKHLTVFVKKEGDKVRLDGVQSFDAEVSSNHPLLKDENVHMYQDSIETVRIDVYKIHSDALKYLGDVPYIESDKNDYVIFPPKSQYMNENVERRGLSMGEINGSSISTENFE
jgi:hypothetical protein